MKLYLAISSTTLSNALCKYTTLSNALCKFYTYIASKKVLNKQFALA